MIPSPERCLELLDEAGCSEDVVEHVAAVADLATAMARRTAADEDVVTAGALLHDVGRGFTHGPDHVPQGVAFLEDEGVDERVVACVARHMGAGIEADEADELGWPEGVWTPQTVEDKLVCHADNLTSGTKPRRLADVLEDLESKGLERVIPRMRNLHEEVHATIGHDPAQLAAELSG